MEHQVCGIRIMFFFGKFFNNNNLIYELIMNLNQLKGEIQRSDLIRNGNIQKRVKKKRLPTKTLPLLYQRHLVHFRHITIYVFNSGTGKFLQTGLSRWFQSALQQQHCIVYNNVVSQGSALSDDSIQSRGQLVIKGNIVFMTPKLKVMKIILDFNPTHLCLMKPDTTK